MSSKEAYKEKMDAQIREWSAKIDLLKAKAERAKAEQKVQYYEQIESLQAKKKELNNKLEELQASSESAWQELKTGVEKAWEDLKISITKASDKFS